MTRPTAAGLTDDLRKNRRRHVRRTKGLPVYLAQPEGLGIVSKYKPDAPASEPAIFALVYSLTLSVIAPSFAALFYILKGLQLLAGGRAKRTPPVHEKLVRDPEEAVIFWVCLSAVWAAPFVVPALAGIFAPRSGPIPLKGGTTNLHVKNSQPRRDRSKPACCHPFGMSRHSFTSFR